MTSSLALTLPVRPEKVRRRSKAPTRSLAVRVDEGVAERLEEQALRAGVNLSDYLRAVLSAHLERYAAVPERLDEIADSVRMVSDNLALAVEALFVVTTNGNPVSREEAAQWVEQNLGTRRRSVPQAV